MWLRDVLNPNDAGASEAESGQRCEAEEGGTAAVDGGGDAEGGAATGGTAAPATADIAAIAAAAAATAGWQHQQTVAAWQVGQHFRGVAICSNWAFL